MTDKIPMTLLGHERLEEELRNLKNVERPAVIRAIASAREHGDLSENAEYHAARERQSFIEGRIQELESKVSHAEVIDVSKLDGKIVRFGATVTLVDDDSGDKVNYQIVGEDEADIK
ncbi:MAG TPA: transcription elongation factor GreA, partial [Alphaproteobacteria bacterium]|nr:transcription elongation factor GreA [Alphaproteobacteria bacterium]